MDKSIVLNKDGVIVFLGGMNAMPMMYAMELRARGYECLYFVDVPPSDRLSRPENHYPDVQYPYPSWVVEAVLPSQLLLLMFPRFFAWFYARKVNRLSGGRASCMMLNGFFTALAPYLSKQYKLISLSHGADLDVWANLGGVKQLADGFKGRSIFRFLPGLLSRYLISRFVKEQYQGYVHSAAVMYFPVGLNSIGDHVVSQLVAEGVRYVSRYDVSFEPLKNESREFKAFGKELVIFSGVRFLFESFPEGNAEYSKGNDIIIKGLAAYRKLNPNVRVHFVEKGEDVQRAKQLCVEHGLESVVTWHKEMTFKDLLALYRMSDICFDQLGSNWIAAIGAYALWLGKPLIANDKKLVATGLWPSENPVCSASTESEVVEWLRRLEDPVLRKKISDRSKAFVEQNMAPSAAIDRLFNV